MGKNWQYSKNQIIKKLNDKGIHLTKKRGQNFLLDKNILNKLISYVDATNIECIIEIGPGIGALTNFLMELNKKLYLIELDKKLYEINIEQYLNEENIHIINNDFLKIDIEKLISPIKKCSVVANIPYNITGKIIERCFLYSNIIKEMYLLVQKEVAQRIISDKDTKTYGSLTVFINTFSKAEILFNIPPNVFYPPPKVESSYIKLKIDDNMKINIDIIRNYSKFLKGIFSYRRKNILNILYKYILNDIKKDKIENELIDIFKIDPYSRPENIHYSKYMELWKYYKDKHL